MWQRQLQQEQRHQQKIILSSSPLPPSMASSFFYDPENEKEYNPRKQQQQHHYEERKEEGLKEEEFVVVGTSNAATSRYCPEPLLLPPPPPPDLAMFQWKELGEGGGGRGENGADEEEEEEEEAKIVVKRNGLVVAPIQGERGGGGENATMIAIKQQSAIGGGRDEFFSSETCDAEICSNIHSFTFEVGSWEIHSSSRMIMWWWQNTMFPHLQVMVFGDLAEFVGWVSAIFIAPSRFGNRFPMLKTVLVTKKNKVAEAVAASSFSSYSLWHTKGNAATQQLFRYFLFSNPRPYVQNIVIGIHVFYYEAPNFAKMSFVSSSYSCTMYMTKFTLVSASSSSSYSPLLFCQNKEEEAEGEDGVPVVWNDMPITWMLAGYKNTGRSTFAALPTKDEWIVYMSKQSRTKARSSPTTREETKRIINNLMGRVGAVEWVAGKMSDPAQQQQQQHYKSLPKPKKKKLFSVACPFSVETIQQTLVTGGGGGVAPTLTYLHISRRSTTTATANPSLPMLITQNKTRWVEMVAQDMRNYEARKFQKRGQRGSGGGEQEKETKEEGEEEYGEPIIPDWQHEYEYEYLLKQAGRKIKTVRLFRADVEIPPPTNVTEHELDSFLTDILLVPDLKSFQTLCEEKNMPQYSTYVPVCMCFDEAPTFLLD